MTLKRPARTPLQTIKITVALFLAASSYTHAWEKTAEKQILCLPLSNVSPKVDGVLDAEEYADGVVLGGSFKGWGVSPRPQSPTVYLKRTADRLFVLYDNPLKEGERPTMRGAVPDNSGICMGNAIELFFMPHLPGEMTQYTQFIGNARGCIFDALSLPEVGVTYVAEYNRPWVFQNRIVPGHWYSEVSVRFSEIGVTSTADGEYFDFDCGRDGGTGPKGVHSYTMAYHQIQSGHGVKVLFDSAAPAVQWLSFADFEQARFAPRLRLRGTKAAGKYTVDFVLTDFEPQQDKTYKEIWRHQEEVAVARGETTEIRPSFDLAKESKGTARYRITDASGKTVFYRELKYQTNATAQPLYPKAEPQSLVVEARMAPSYGRLGVSADIIDYEGDKSRAVVEAVAFAEGNHQPLGKTILDRFQLDYAEGILEAGPIRPGAYRVAFRMLDRQTRRPVGKPQEVRLVRRTYEWENNALGLSETPPAPWTPVELKTRGRLFRREEVACVWGREYTFTGLGLPKSVPTLQPSPTRGPEIADVLAGPVRLVAQRSSRACKWRLGPSAIAGTDANTATVVGRATTEGLAAEVNGQLDYDGFYKIHLKITPTRQQRFESIRVEVPVPTRQARLFHSVGESMRTNKTFAHFEGLGDGVLWDSKSAACNSLIKGNFLPVAWLGDEDRGIAWMCDTDRTWQITFDRPCLDVVRQGEETVFRMHLLNRPGALEHPIEVTFSLQATPVRPRPPGGSWKKTEWYGWGYFDRPLIYDGCFKGIEEPGDRAPQAWYRTRQAREKNRWWRYGCLNSDRITVQDKKYGAMVRDFGAEWYCENVFMKHHNRAHRDFELWAYKQWHDVASMDGVYFDNTFPAPSLNLLNNSAYVDAEGRLRPGYGVMGYREFLKRLRTMLLGFGPAPVLKAHITDTPIPGHLGFCDFWLDGENGGYPPREVETPDFVDRWYNKTGLANLRITLGQQWGPIPQYLYDWGIEPTYAVLGMFDLENDFKAMGRTPYHDFGRFEEDVEFIPYWSLRPAARVVAGGPDVFVTSWRRQGQARFLISNLSNEDRRVSIEVDRARLGLPKNCAAVDERQGGALPLRDGVVMGLDIPRHDYRTLIVSEPGLHGPLPPDLGQALRPPQATWIEELCDDFSSIETAWQRNTSPHIRKSTHRAHGVPSEAFDIFLGHLRIRTSSYMHASVSRPFGQDGCSVQVKLREPDGRYGQGFGPGLHLYWENGAEAHLMAWDGVGTTGFACEGKLAGKRVFRKQGGKPEKVNWGRVTLKPEGVEFHISTDGKTWSILHRQPRKGFEGAPASLALGHGHRKDGPIEGYAYDSYFDDLITARLPE